MKKIVLMFVFIAAGLSLFAEQPVFVSEEKTFSSALVKNVVVQTQNIEVEVYAGDSVTDVVLKQTKDLKNKLSAELKDGTLNVSVTEDKKCRRKCIAKLELYVSKLDSLNITTKNESIELDGLDIANIKLTSNNGDIELENILCRNVSAISTNGELEFTNVSCDINAQSSNGEIDFENISGSVKAQTSTGDISLKYITGTVEADTKNGDIKARNLPNREVTLKSLNGKISRK
ncbi:hypothetical protein Dip510_001409 [Elusimicrobium posterum]|uniref:DUF4097 family beta strand repeat-containing protein n=1 Tax=Elusimicrobium posterum TaxID=3116653 RepID=UPI003C738DCC